VGLEFTNIAFTYIDHSPLADIRLFVCLTEIQKEGWVDLGNWLRTVMHVFPPADRHQFMPQPSSM